jgi:hypothetical protein
MKPELESALKRLLEKLAHTPDPPAAKENKWNWLNSPVVITVIGGALIAIISGTLSYYSAINAKDREIALTQRNADNTKEREIALETLRRKQNFVDTFATKIDQYLTLTFGLRKREIFLFQWQNAPDRAMARYPDGRTFEQTRTKWEEDTRYWIDHSSASPLAIIYTAKILFPKPEIVEKLDHLAKVVDVYGLTMKPDELIKADDQILSELDDVSSLLAKDAYAK